MASYEIPLNPGRPQIFTISLGGQDYQLTLLWNPMASCWMLDIADASGNPVLLGTPVVTGLDLLYQHKHLEIPGSLVVQTDFDTDSVPTFNDLGQTGRIYFITSDA